MTEYNLNMLAMLYLLLCACIPVWSVIGICKMFKIDLVDKFARLIMGDEYEPF